jgi:hypothetical protein
MSPCEKEDTPDRLGIRGEPVAPPPHPKIITAARASWRGRMAFFPAGISRQALI